MQEYISNLKFLLSNFSYQEFDDLLKRIDNDIINGNIHEFDDEFLQLFDQIMSFINDEHIVEGKHVTLGHTLIETSLINKQKLPPTLITYYYLEQKKNIGLEQFYNKIRFTRAGTISPKMSVTEEINGESFSEINLDSYEIRATTDEFNYEVMHDLVHEITHIYQENCSKDSDNPFEKLTYYDYKMMNILITKIFGGTNGNSIIAHESLVSEFMADEQADSYMLQIAKSHPEYFNSTLIEKKMDYYQNKRNGVYGDIYINPRVAFDELLEYIKDLYIMRENGLETIQPVLDEIETVKQSSQPVIELLKTQGISEQPSDYYYNIFFKSFYHFDGKELIISNKTMEKSTINENPIPNLDNTTKTAVPITKAEEEQSTTGEENGNLLDEHNATSSEKITNSQENSDISTEKQIDYNSSLTLKQKIAQFLQRNSTLMKAPFIHNFVNRQLNILPPPVEKIKTKTDERKDFENRLSDNGRYKNLPPIPQISKQKDITLEEKSQEDSYEK